MTAQHYAVIGNPIGHSKSPQIHMAFAQQFAIDLHYTKILSEPDAFTAAVHTFRGEGGLGMNVTVPFKYEAYTLADDVSAAAQQAQAVNTLSFTKAGIKGDNTDGVGLLRDLEANLHFTLAGTDILIVGAGGASQGIVEPLLNAEIKSLTICNRTPAKAEKLATQFATLANITACNFDVLAGKQFDLVINATSASLSDTALPLPDEIFKSHSLAYDLAYSDEPTTFMQWALQQGAQHACDGLGMLVEQAAAAFAIWHQQQPDTGVVLKQLREN